MHWFSFILGLLVGWIVEWLIDLAYWRRRYYECTEAAASLRAELKNAQRDLGARRSGTDDADGVSGELAAARARIRELEDELAELRNSAKAGASLAPAATAVEDANVMPPMETRTSPAVAAPAAAPAAEPDDLVIIEGIGPAIARLLQDHGIRSFADLAVATPEALSGILASGGKRFRLANPSTWPEQARLAAAGDFEGLTKLQDRLERGRA